MKLVTFIHQDQERIGAVEDAGHIVDLERAMLGTCAKPKAFLTQINWPRWSSAARCASSCRAAKKSGRRTKGAHLCQHET